MTEKQPDLPAPTAPDLTPEDLVSALRNSKGWPTLGNAAADYIEHLTAELAEARATPAPTDNVALVEAIKAIPHRKEVLGGQTLSYVQLGEVLDTIEDLSSRAAAPTPAPVVEGVPERVWLEPTGVREGWTGCADQVVDGDIEYVRADLATPPEDVSALVEAAKAVVDRWDSPLWGGSASRVRHTGEYISHLRAALAKHKGGA